MRRIPFESCRWNIGIRSSIQGDAIKHRQRPDDAQQNGFGCEANPNRLWRRPATRRGVGMISTIATRLRELRHRLGFHRRSDMAQHLGLPSSTYSAYEGDAGPPKVEWLMELAQRGVNLNWLLTGEGEMFVPPHAVTVAGTPVTAPAPTPPSGAPPGAPSGGKRPPPAEPRDPDVDPYLLAAMISRVEREQRERSQPLTALEKGEMIARLYVVSARLTESELAGHPLSRAAEGSEK